MLDALPEVTARIGLMFPSSNRLTEPQMRRYAPRGVEIHVTRLPSLQPTIPGIQAMMNFLAPSVPKLANYKPEQFVDTRFLSQLPT